MPKSVTGDGLAHSKYINAPTAQEIKDYLLEYGDLLHIPKGIRHKSISSTPRIIASVGFFAGKSFE
jgi:ribosomal protein L16 Arg81 hydroxylase